MTISTSRKILIFQFLDTPMAEREMSHAEFRKKHRISAKIWRNLLADYTLNQKELAQRQKLELKARARMEKDLYGDEIEFKYDSKSFLRARSREVDEALIEACKKGNANALKVYKQILGELTDKSEIEVKFGLTAEEHFRIAREADRRTREVSGGTNGTPSLPEKSTILPQEIRQGDTSQTG